MRHDATARLERGHTLIEVMIATAIFTVGVLGIMPLYYRTAEGLTTSNKLVEATALAEAKLHELRRLPWDDALLDEGDHDDGTLNLGPAGLPLKPDGSATGAIGDNDGWYARRWSVDDQDTRPDVLGDEWKQISVEVSWSEGSGGNRRRVVIAGGKAR